jgi:hypothetical protein
MALYVAAGGRTGDYLTAIGVSGPGSVLFETEVVEDQADALACKAIGIDSAGNIYFVATEKNT